MLTPPVSYCFGKFTLLPRERRLVADGREVPLGPRAFDVLVALVERGGQLATKEVLLAIVWRGLVVEEANLHVQVSLLRKSIGTMSIATVPGLGYRFAMPLDPAEGHPVVGLRRLSVIVLPFVEPRASPDQEYFADAITDDITTQLSKISGSYVVGSPTALAYKREKFEVASLARELGVRYALQGRIERSEASVEINARLSEAATGAVVWSDAIEVGKAGVRNIRHEVVARLANALGIHLFVAEGRRTGRENAEHPEASDLVMQARSAGGLTWSRDHYLRALELLERALRIDPENTESLTWRAACLVTQAESWPGPEIATQIARAEADLVKSLALDSCDYFAHEMLSRVRHLQFRHDAAVIGAETALELNPNAARTHVWRGALHMYAGRCEATFGPVQRALELSPRDPHRWAWLLFLGMACLLSGDYAGAVKWLERSLSVLPSYWASIMMLMAAYAQLGQINQAKALRENLGDGAEVHRRWARVADNPRFLAQMREHYFKGLIKAGALSGQVQFESWVARQRLDAPEARLLSA